MEEDCGKKRNYTTYSGRRTDTNYGTIHTENVQVNDLPEIGEYVVVNEKHVYERAKGDQLVMAVYCPNLAFVDAYGFPAIYRVAGYTNGRDKPLDPKNFVLLERTIREGLPDEKVFKTMVKTISVATGSMYLEVVDKDTKFTSKGIDYAECLIAELSAGNLRNLRKDKNSEDKC